MSGTYHFICDNQPGSQFLTFVVPAKDLISFAKIDRFSEAEEGVERKLNYKQAAEIAKFMRRPDASISEPILGDLRGPWAIDNEHQLITWKEGAQLMVDDGQHRIAALRMLPAEIQKLWNFKVTATMNTPYETRIKRFIQQISRLRIDSQLILQLRDRVNLFPDDVERITYDVIKRLATEEDSPLYGLVRLDERTVKRQPIGADLDALLEILNDPRPPAVQLREQTLLIDVMGIIRDVRLACFGQRSVIQNRTPEQKYDAIAILLSAARDVWSDEWSKTKEFFLRRADGIGGLVQLFSRGDAFKECLRIAKGVQQNKRLKSQTEIMLNYDAFKRVLEYAQDFKWSFQYYKKQGTRFPKPAEIAQGIDALIHKNMPRTRKEREGAGVGT